MQIVRYTPAMRARWDEFASRSRCGTFLFQRAYLDYHSHRFTDCSLLAFTPRGKLIAMLPAEIDGSTVSSHRGLTYGGWITPMRHFDASTMLQVFDAALSFLRGVGASELVYKPLPHIYPLIPADEDLYALFRFGARQTECSVSSAIDLRRPAKLNESTNQAVRRAQAAGVCVRRSDDFAGFWAVLGECLMSRHGVAPVHSLDEILLLKSRFPDSIHLFTATLDGNIAAGAVVYYCERVAHVQYMATTPLGRETKALSMLINEIATRYCAGRTYLDFGTSTENGGRTLNSGLLLQKSGHGASGVACSTFSLSI